MRKAAILLTLLLLALPIATSGEESAMPTEAFIRRIEAASGAPFEADGALEERIGAFLREKGLTPRAIEKLDDARLLRYARHLEEDLPIDYLWLEEAPSEPMPEGARLMQLAVLQPAGAATESLLVDFERGLAYYDENWPVIEDVCRAAFAAPLSGDVAENLRKLLNGIALVDHIGEPEGMEFNAIRICAAWDGGVTRCAAMGGGIPEEYLSGVRALLDAGRAAAQGDAYEE